MTNKNKKITVVVLFLVFGSLLTYNIMYPHKEKSIKKDNTSQISSRNDNSSSTRLMKDDETEKKSLQEVEWEQKYSGNQLENGSQPYMNLYGKNKKSGNSEIRITAPTDEDVIVMIKDDKGDVVGHAYIRNTQKYTFHVNAGHYYQVFFICGKDWCPEKKALNGLNGDFLQSNTSKATPIYLHNNEYYQYILQSQINGNFTPQSANPEEAF